MELNKLDGKSAEHFRGWDGGTQVLSLFVTFIILSIETE